MLSPGLFRPASATRLGLARRGLAQLSAGLLSAGPRRCASSSPSSAPRSPSAIAREIALKLKASPPSSQPAYRIAIVGAGPAGLYVAHHLLKHNADVRIDLFERLPMPFGLVRYGVAPDHPEVKNVTNQFESVLGNPLCSYYGGVTVGQDISVSELQTLYSSVVLTYGAESDRSLGVPLETPPGASRDDEAAVAASGGVIPARSFVGWYNGHPDYARLNPQLSRGDTAVIFGQGNVSLDIARMLLSPLDRLRATDIADHALDALAASTIRKVLIIGRRGPLEVSFTIKELREMVRLPGTTPLLEKQDFDFSKEEVDLYSKDRPRKRLTELLLSTAAANPGESHSPAKSWKLLFKQSPHAIERDESGNVVGVHVSLNELSGPPSARKALPTSRTIFHPCSVVIRSIGYQSTPMEGVPFDARARVVPNVGGRVLCPSDWPDRSAVWAHQGHVFLRGMYCSGWVKHGPVGIIATTMSDSFATGAVILEDLKSGALRTASDISAALPELTPGEGEDSRLPRQSGLVDYRAFVKLNEHEVQQGSAQGRPRRKLLDAAQIASVLEAAG